MVDSGIIADWNNSGLPDDRFSKENAAIMEKAKRWPLIIDPQLQATKFIKGKYNDLMTTTQTEKAFERKVEQAITSGKVLIIENIKEDLEPTLDPILTRA